MPSSALAAITHPESYKQSNFPLCLIIAQCPSSQLSDLCAAKHRSTWAQLAAGSCAPALSSVQASIILPSLCTSLPHCLTLSGKAYKLPMAVYSAKGWLYSFSVSQKICFPRPCVKTHMVLISVSKLWVWTPWENPQVNIEFGTSFFICDLWNLVYFYSSSKINTRSI